MNDKKKSRMRRARRTRSKIRELGSNRLCVNRTPRHIYAQVISSDGGHVLASASTLDKKLRTGSTGNVDAAKGVGLLVAERAKKQAYPLLHLIVVVINIMVVLKL